MNNNSSVKVSLRDKAIATAIILAGWKLLTLVFPPMIFPSISAVLGKLAQIVATPTWYETIVLTMGRLVVGMGLGVVLGCICGALMGVFPRIRGVLSPLISLLQTVPPVSWVVIALIWFGFNGKPAVFIVLTATLPVIAINISEGFAQLDQRLLQMAQVYRFSWGKKLRHVVFPSLFPFFYSALRITLGNGWKIAVMGEVLTTSDGIGGMLKTARLNIEMESVIAWTVIMVILFYFSDWLLSVCFREGKGKGYAASKRN